ncbi:glycosyltransferase family 2 protein [Pseudarthrobacter sp. YAF2]|uniref:glycosyltransferase family 2 protein n=1 Tax=Pseudarthrobacter sp. YAF2 TaxID=3233078 RepID=UPI003F9A2FF6
MRVVKGRDEDIRWSIITVSYNSAEVLEQHWQTDIPAGVEWIVVDNCSTDSSVATAKDLGARVIELEKNAGFSAANNIGLRESLGEYVAFVNPDVVVGWESLQDLELLINESGGLVSPQLLNPDGSKQPNGRGAPSLSSKIRNRLNSNTGSTYQVLANEGETKYVAWLIGAVIAGSAASFVALRGWDESYFLYYEDKDISLRAWRHGIPVLLCGDVTWKHSWARATKHFSFGPWKREIASGLRFYSREPRLLYTASPGNRNLKSFTLSGTPYKPSATFSGTETK